MAMTANISKGFQLDMVSFSYTASPCLQDISITLEPGYLYGLIGPNGSGKSTLLDLLSAYLQPLNGSISLAGKPLASYKRTLLAAFLTAVPQSFTFNFDYRVYDAVLMGRHPYVDRFASPTEQDHRQVDEALELMDIAHLAQRSITRLSGGEKQRVMIARALAQDTEFLLLDEVTANLDINHGISIMQTMADLIKQGRTVIAALHDLNMALAFCDRIIVLKDGRLHHYGDAADIITSQMIADIYQVDAEIVRTSDEPGYLHFSYRS